MKKRNLLFTAIAILGFTSITIAQVPSYVPASGLVGWWPFNGNANDESGNGNNGTVNGATLTTDRFSSLNAAYHLDGIGNNIHVANNFFDNGSVSWSISIWYNLDQLPNPNNGNSSHTLFNTSPHNGLGLGMNWGSSSKYSLFLGEGTPANSWNTSIFNVQSSQNVTINSWHNVVLVKSGNIFSLYIDGVFDTNWTSGTTISSYLYQMYFGSTDPVASAEVIIGDIDDIGIWNRALTECEIQDLYNAQLNSSTSIQAGTDVSICEGNDLIFNGSGGSNYTWNNGVQNGMAYTPSISQEYIVIGQDANNCYGTDTIYVELIPNTTATQTETALDSYTWPINSQTYTQSGTYTAVIPNAAGCDSTITLDLSLDFTGIEDNSQSALFSVFPNPAQSLINIKVDSKLIGSVYTIYDNTGRAVLSGKLNSKDTTIELNNLSGGIYMLSVGENMKQTFKVIKE
jgi:hypothetical protein